MISDKCEQKIKEVIKEYGAWKDVEKDILDFLFDSANIYSIAELIKEDIINKIVDNNLKPMADNANRIANKKNNTDTDINYWSGLYRGIEQVIKVLKK